MTFPVLVIAALVAKLIAASRPDGAQPAEKLSTDNEEHAGGALQHRLKRSYGGLSDQDIQIIVDEHNRYRSLVNGGNLQQVPVVWDPQLAANAQAWSDRCLFAHSNNRWAAGENIWAGPFYWGSIGAAATRFWYNEAFNPYCSCSNRACCGHYRQLVWPHTTRLGCGYTVCSSITYAWGQRYLLVCQYSPGARY